MENKNNVLKYTVKKFSVGTFSVLVGAFIFLAGPALASETNSSENIHKENNVIIDKGNHNESSVFKNVSNEKNIEKSISEDVKVNDLAKKKKDSIRKDVLIEGNEGQNSKVRNNMSVVSERESKKQFATDENLVKISKGLITTEDSKIDNLLFGKEPLKANEDSDGDNVKNSREIYTYEKDGKTYYGYYGHPFLKDTDGDGVIDHDQSDLSKPRDDDNFKWYVTDRDMALFMKLSYRDDSYIKKVLDKDYQWTKADNIVKGDSKPENKYELMHNELSQYWEVDKTYHYDSGLDAVLFKTKSALSIVPDGLVHILAIRGTKGGKDISNDVVVAFGQNPQQGKEIEEIIKDIGLREDIKNFYITGHSLGGYLTQRAVVKLHKLANEENGYLIEPAAKKYRDFYHNAFKKATTFNAPKIVASILNRDLYNKSILSKQLAKEGKIKHYGMSGDNVARLLYNDKDVMTYIEKGEHSSNAYFSSILNDDDNFNVGERTGVTGKGKQNSVLKTLKIVEPTTEQVRKIVNENMKISLKDKNPLEILALNKISREKVLEKLNLDNLPKTAILNIAIPEGIQPTATTYTLNVAVNYLGKTINTNVGVLVKVLPNFEELKSIKQEAVLESEKKINTDNKTSKIKSNYSAKKEELKIKLQKAEELLKNSNAKQTDIRTLTKELETALEEYKTVVRDLRLDKTLLTDEIMKATKKLEVFKNTNTALSSSEVMNEFNIRKDKLLNDYNSLFKKVKSELDTIETYDKLVKEKDKLANLEKDIASVLSVLNKQQKDYYEPIGKIYEIYEGDTPNAELVIEKNNLPVKSIIWERTPETSKFGTKKATVRVVYRDGSFDLVNVNIDIKALYGEVTTKTEVKTIPLKVIYREDNTKNIGYVNTIAGTEGRVVTTIKSRLNKKTNILEEIGRETVTTKAVDTIIIRGTKPKVEIKKPSSLIRFEKRYKNHKVVEKQQKNYSRKRRR